MSVKKVRRRFQTPSDPERQTQMARSLPRTQSDMDHYRATPASIAAAKASAAAEREEARKAGIETDENGHLIIPELGLLRMALIENEGIPIDDRVTCSEAVEALIGQYGLRCLLRSVRVCAAVRHIEVTTRDNDRVASLLEPGDGK